jgi:hypothetical protein
VGLPEDEIRALYWKVMAVARGVQGVDEAPSAYRSANQAYHAK